MCMQIMINDYYDVDQKENHIFLFELSSGIHDFRLRQVRTTSGTTCSSCASITFAGA
eukprot:m.333018 g.333018  ORF g.333018 m.333018 type:complete len:57 (-) comp17045_c0_seq1:1238-1408(-)